MLSEELDVDWVADSSIPFACASLLSRAWASPLIYQVSCLLSERIGSILWTCSFKLIVEVITHSTLLTELFSACHLVLWCWEQASTFQNLFFFHIFQHWLSDIRSPAGSNGGNRLASGLEAISMKKIYPFHQCCVHWNSYSCFLGFDLDWFIFHN